MIPDCCTDLAATGLSSEDFVVNTHFPSVLPWVNQCAYEYHPTALADQRICFLDQENTLVPDCYTGLAAATPTPED